MQHRYFGDVGDFGKFGLLRILSRLDEELKLRLGVVWYLYPDESHNADGKHVNYLTGNDQVFRRCDEYLYDKLRALLFDDLRMIQENRHLKIAETSGILPENTVFYNEPLSYPKELSVPTRMQVRKEWFTAALTKTAPAEMVFLDPDNGIECVSVTRTSNKGPKYVFWDDIDAFIQRGQSVVVYHHLGRDGSHLEQIEDKLRQMDERFVNGFKTFHLRFRRGNGRAYFIIVSPRHYNLLYPRIEKIRSSLWNRHFFD